VLLDKLPAAQRADLARRLTNMASVAPVDARVLGRAYEKQVDVVIARWDRRPEVLISTKAQLSSFGKNLPNRFEESYGDSGNLRGRYPLAAVRLGVAAAALAPHGARQIVPAHCTHSLAA
jgi:hypothetical protein